MNDRIPRNERDLVLVDVKAKPSGWPTASLDPDSGRGPRATSGMPAHEIRQNQVSTVSGDCRQRTVHLTADEAWQEAANLVAMLARLSGLLLQDLELFAEEVNALGVVEVDGMALGVESWLAQFDELGPTGVLREV